MTTAEAEAPGATKAAREWVVLKQPEMRIKREAAALSRSHVALALGVSVGAIQNWEAGNSTPTVDHQEQMLALFTNPPTIEAAAGAPAAPTNGTHDALTTTEPASRPAPTKRSRKPRVVKPKATKVAKKIGKVKTGRSGARAAAKAHANGNGAGNPLAAALAMGAPVKQVRFDRPNGDALAAATATVTAALLAAGKLKFVSDVAAAIRDVRQALLS